jgi:hypothetical protein
MALKQDMQLTGKIVFQSGAGEEVIETTSRTHRDVYIKVANVTGTKEKANCQVEFASASLNWSKQYRFVPSMDGANFIKQAYEHLKTLPEFQNAIDC